MLGADGAMVTETMRFNMYLQLKEYTLQQETTLLSIIPVTFDSSLRQSQLSIEPAT